jgi:hypothetical protein
MGEGAAPLLIGEGVIVCCGFRYEVTADDMYLAMDDRQWQAAEKDDPHWSSSWRPLDESAWGGLQGPFESGALHTTGHLLRGEQLLSITVHDWATTQWIEAPFAVARGRLWLAHLPRWTIALRVLSTNGVAETEFVHRRYADYHADMPDGLTQIPQPPQP